MTFGRALTYFSREALVNLVRSWKTSLLAVMTIAVSLFVGGSFLILATNASRVIEDWKKEAKVVVYLAAGVGLEQAGPVEVAVASAPWVGDVGLVSAAEGRERFQESFPSVAGLVEGWEAEPLPASLEVSFDPLLVEDVAFQAWTERLADMEEVSLVDDDRDWVDQLELGLRLLLSIGLALGAVLLGAAVLTIASVIRLTAILYQDEIAVMRLVGATEFFIRGPFYMEGLWQGLIGGLVALLALFGGFSLVEPLASSTLVLGSVTGSFIGWGTQILLVIVGGAAGLLGAVVSLRREALKA